MELLLKLYGDKPSRVGVRYTYGYQAIRAYEDLVRKYPAETFSLRLEPAGSKINLALRSDQSGKLIPYPDLEYRPELLNKIQSLSEQYSSLQFVHLYREGNQLLIAKPFKKQEFFTVTHYEIIGSVLQG